MIICSHQRLAIMKSNNSGEISHNYSMEDHKQKYKHQNDSLEKNKEKRTQEIVGMFKNII